MHQQDPIFCNNSGNWYKKVITAGFILKNGQSKMIIKDKLGIIKVITKPLEEVAK